MLNASNACEQQCGPGIISDGFVRVHAGPLSKGYRSTERAYLRIAVGLLERQSTARRGTHHSPRARRGARVARGCNGQNAFRTTRDTVTCVPTRRKMLPRRYYPRRLVHWQLVPMWPCPNEGTLRAAFAFRVPTRLTLLPGRDPMLAPPGQQHMH